MIKINDEYFIKSELYDFALLRDLHTTNKKGVPIYSTLGYYGTITACLEAALKDAKKARLRKGETISLAEAIDIIRECDQEFADILKKTLKNN